MSWNYKWDVADGWTVSICPQSGGADGGSAPVVSIEVDSATGVSILNLEIPVDEWLSCTTRIQEYMRSAGSRMDRAAAIGEGRDRLAQMAAAVAGGMVAADPHRSHELVVRDAVGLAQDILAEVERVER